MFRKKPSTAFLYQVSQVGLRLFSATSKRLEHEQRNKEASVIHDGHQELVSYLLNPKCKLAERKQLGKILDVFEGKCPPSMEHQNIACQIDLHKIAPRTATALSQIQIQHHFKDFAPRPK